MEGKTQNGFSSLALEHAERPRNRGIPEAFDAHARITGPCGDTMEFWLVIRDGVVHSAWFDTDGCRSSIACGSMAAFLAEDESLEECGAMSPREILRALGGIPAQGEHCALLAANTLRAACKDYAARTARGNT
ncbi:MAG: iron-sulfur cluster assembly scaffold protein [Candidatus Hydrogenedentes bacterium]|nr:iron-sulfur cluster assembly scaffold protein [Candidatus Hydrogenedentota bacterium]